MSGETPKFALRDPATLTGEEMKKMGGRAFNMMLDMWENRQQVDSEKMTADGKPIFTKADMREGKVQPEDIVLGKCVIKD